MAHPVAAAHAGDAEEDVGNAEDLSHVEEHLALETYLDVLGPLNEEAEGEDEGEHQSEVPAATYRVRIPTSCFLDSLTP